MVRSTNPDEAAFPEDALGAGDDADRDGSMAGELLDEASNDFPDDPEAREMTAAAAAAFAQPEAQVSPGNAPTGTRGGYRSRREAPRSRFLGLKATAVPILLTVGVLLLVPGMWALMLLAGRDVWESEREDAAAMAKVMIACLPIGLVLISSSVVFYVQLRADAPRRGGSV